MSQGTTAVSGPEAAQEFSLSQGGLFSGPLARLGFPGPGAGPPRRRVLLALAVAWLPLLILAALEGWLWVGEGLAFLHDAAAQVRFLVALPLLLVAEHVVHQQMRHQLPQFVVLGLVAEPQVPSFVEAIASARRWLDSRWVEVLLLVLVYAVALGRVMPEGTFVAGASWYGEISPQGDLSPTVAGYWLGLVSLPLFQFLLLRWYFRLIVWWRLLWKISRLDLNLQTLHPDRMGGLGFLSRLSLAFVPLLFAQGALTAGLIADQILYAGATLAQFRLEIAVACGFILLLVLGPLLMFSRPLGRAKHEALARHGQLSMRYLRAVSRKWSLDNTYESGSLADDPDLQALEDLGDSYQRVEDLRVVPLAPAVLVQVLASVAAPMLPLLLTTFSVEEMVSQVMKVLI